MDDLIQRIEAAEGADRELNWLIAEALGEIPYHVIQGPVGIPYGWFRGEGEWSLKCIKASDVYSGVESWSPKPYTASIDAALTLVPEGYDWSLDSFYDGQGRPHAWVCKDGPFYIAIAATPALALCAAALKAHIERTTP